MVEELEREWSNVQPREEKNEGKGYEVCLHLTEWNTHVVDA